MEGWLQKKGHIFSTWKRRFFILEDRTLSYYETDDLKKKKGEYVIDADSRVELNSTNQKMFILYAIGSGGQELELLASEQKDVTAWKEALERAREIHVAESALVNASLQKTGQAPVGVKGTGGSKVISGIHLLTDIGISPNLKVSCEMQICYEVMGMRGGALLQYDEHISPASDEKSREVKCYVSSFETAFAPVVRYPHEEGDFYTLLLLDPDHPSALLPSLREHVLWAVVNIPGDQVRQGTVVCPYQAPVACYMSGAHRFVFLLCLQGKHLVCPVAARTFFHHRSPLRSASFLAQTPLFASASGALRDVRASGELSGQAGMKEVQQRMSIAAVSLFYSQWDESADLMHCLAGEDTPEVRKFPSPAQALVQRLPTHDGASMMLLGSLVAEAACCGVEWIYDQQQLADKVSEGGGALSCLAFRDPPECPYFCYPTGRQGFYHEQIQTFRRCLAITGGVSEEDQAAAYDAFYGGYVTKDRPNAADITEKYVDRLTKTFLTNLRAGKPWRECGIDQFEAQSLTKVPTLAARHGGDLYSLLADVRKMVRIWQTDEGCAVSSKFCTLMARLLDLLLRTRCSPAEALQQLFDAARAQTATKSASKDSKNPLSGDEIKILQSVEIVESVLLAKIQDIKSVLALNTSATDRQKLRIQTELTRALLVGGTGDGTELHFRNIIAGVTLQAADKDMWKACKALAKDSKWAPSPREPLDPSAAASLLGTSCDVHGTFFIVCYLMMRCSSYQEAVQLNMLLGGDSCSRAVLLGAVFAAPVYPLPASDLPLQFCPSVEANRPFYGDNDAVSALRQRGSWIPIDWLCKCEEECLGEVLRDAEVFEVCRSEVLLVGGGSSRLAHLVTSALAGGQPRVRVVHAPLSEPDKLAQLVHANTRAVLLLTGEASEDAACTQELLQMKLLAVLKALEACPAQPPLVFMSSTSAALPSTGHGRLYSAVEKYLDASALSSTAVRTPWIMESLFDQTKQIRNGVVSMFLAPSSLIGTVSMVDVARAVASILIDPSIVSNEKCLTFAGRPVRMSEVAAVLSEVAGRRVEYRQVDSRQAFLEAMTSSNAISKADADALKETCKAVEEWECQQALQAAVEAADAGDGNAAGSEVMMTILQRCGHFHEIFGPGEQAVAPGPTSMKAAMQALPQLKSEEKRACTAARNKAPLGEDITRGRWCLKKFTSESKFQRRFIRLDTEDSTFCWSKKESQAVPKSVSLSLCDVEVSKFEDLVFVPASEGRGSSVEWTVTCPASLKGMKGSGGVTIKMCSDDPEISSQVDDEEDFKAYVKAWVTQISDVIEQGMSH